MVRVISWLAGWAIATSISTIPLPTLAAQLSEIQQRGKLIIAVKDNIRPLGWRTEDDRLVGFEIDLARELARIILGNPDAVELRPVSNRDRLAVVLTGDVDLAIARMTATQSRSRVVDFSPYYYLDGTDFVTRNPAIEEVEDLVASPIAVLENSSTIPVVRSELPSAQLVGVESYQEALSLLEAGDVDAFAGDRSVLAGWVQEYPQYRQLQARLSGFPLAVVMPRGLQYVELRQQVIEAIAQLRQSGKLQQLQQRWGLP